MEYFVARNLEHDCVAYSRGDQIDLPEDVAERLLDEGVIQEDPIVDPEPVENLGRVRRSAKKKKAQKDEPQVGGAPTETGEPSVDGPQEPSGSPAEDVTPGGGTEPENDPSEDL